MQRLDRAKPTARGMRFQRGTFNTKHEHDGKAAGVVQGPPDLHRPDAPVVRIYHDDADGLPVLVVKDVA